MICLTKSEAEFNGRYFQLLDSPFKLFFLKFLNGIHFFLALHLIPFTVKVTEKNITLDNRAKGIIAMNPFKL